jgi:competence protein ComEA
VRDPDRALLLLAVVLCAIPVARSLAPRPAPLEHVPIRTEADRLLAGEKMDLNAASAVDLALVDGIGPSIAERIVERRRDEPFASTRDLERVRGVGPKKRRMLEAYVEVRPRR